MDLLVFCTRKPEYLANLGLMKERVARVSMRHETNPSQSCHHLKLLFLFTFPPLKGMILQKGYRNGNLVFLIQLLNIVIEQCSRTLLLLNMHLPCALCFFTHLLIKLHFTSIVGLEGNRIYDHQFLQLRNNGFRIWRWGWGCGWGWGW
jgi:hypothetical protein